MTDREDGLYAKLHDGLGKYFFPIQDVPFKQRDIREHFNWRGTHIQFKDGSVFPVAEVNYQLSKLLYNLTRGKEPVLRHTWRGYEVINRDVDILDWQNEEDKSPLNLLWPFNLEKWVALYPANLAVIAGTSNAGKTSFCLNFVVMNSEGEIPVDYYNSEIGASQLKDRMRPFNVPKPAPFVVYSRVSHFADVIDKDHISVIDYVEYVTEVREIKEEIEAVFRKLQGGKGMALIAIQKKFDAKNFKGQKIIHDLGYGAETTLARPSLYLTMNPASLKILKCKTPLGKRSIDGMAWRYSLIEGAHFTGIERLEDAE